MSGQDYIDTTLDEWARARPGVDVTPLAVTQRLIRGGMLVSERIETVIRAAGLRTTGDYRTLVVLRRHHPAPVRATQLAAEVLVSAPGLTGRLDRLEQSELVTRSSDPTDGRAVLVGLTRRGRSVAERTQDAVLALHDTVVAGLSLEDAEVLATLLRRVMVALGDLPDAPDEADDSTEPA